MRHKGNHGKEEKLRWLLLAGVLLSVLSVALCVMAWFSLPLAVPS